MAKIIQYRDNCMGCGACVALYPQYFEIDPEDGKAKIKGAKEKNGVWVLEVTDAEAQDFIEMAPNCPANIIKVLDDNGNEMN